ncbi:cupredoxin domain-containing protein [Paenibacillus mendelii]|uniref:Cupredoxin domain-containing protein n=1 Tax=Paenibacillus mendelii TaxID=206163 RepID=A0ABV6J427_9BACL|nr:cupredoxin domain-containing protein [Paenibacillus mendelii]MCQ6561837.1 cupredoxin domain-containing protein [Paenibacillus mendelii]
MKSKKFSLFAALMLVVLALAVSACGNNNADTNSNGGNSSTPSNSADSNSNGAAGGETKEITLNASNWKFDQTEIKVNKGDTIKLTLKSDEGNHGVAIEDLGIELKNDETKEFTVNDAGTFEFHCSIQCGQGHNDMKGNLIVE